MDVGNATIIAAAIAAAVSLGSSVFAWCAANKSNKAAAQSNEVTNSCLLYTSDAADE